MKYCSGERRAKGLMGRVHLKCETPGSSWSISCNKVRFLASIVNNRSVEELNLQELNLQAVTI